MFSKKYKRGSVFLISVILLSVISFVTVGLYKYVVAFNRLDEIKNDGIIAFYAAEAGVNKVIHFFNNPGDFTTDRTLFYYDESADKYPNLVARLASGAIKLDTSYYPRFDFARSSDGKLCQVVDLTILPPIATDPSGCFAKIRSVGVTYNPGAKRNVTKTIHLYLFSGGLAVKSPAGIVSKSASMFNGDVVVKWGEVWSKGVCDLPNSSKFNNFVDVNDPNWTAVRTDSYFLMQGGNYMDGSRTGSVYPLTPADGERYYNPCQSPCQLSRFDGRFLQNQRLKFPEFKYEEYKELAMRRGEYYGTDSLGNIYREGIKDAEHKVSSFDDEFCRMDPNANLRMVFIDTIDGTAPKADGSNLANLKITGSGPHTKGFLYVCANLDVAGLGNSPSVTVQNPALQNVNINKLWMNGLLYVAGVMNVTGNPVIYGSLIVEREITGNGTPNVFYNYKLGTGLFFPINSQVKARLYKVQ